MFVCVSWLCFAGHVWFTKGFFSFFIVLACAKSFLGVFCFFYVCFLFFFCFIRDFVCKCCKTTLMFRKTSENTRGRAEKKQMSRNSKNTPRTQSERNQNAIRTQSENNQNAIRTQSERNQNAIRKQSERSQKHNNLGNKIKILKKEKKRANTAKHLYRPTKTRWMLISKGDHVFSFIFRFFGFSYFSS